MIDYSKYSLDELLEIKGVIDPKSPNFSAFNQELEKRRSVFEQHQLQEEQKQYDLDKLKIKTVGCFQLVSAVVLTLILLYNSFSGSGMTVATFTITLLLVVLNGFAGYTAFLQLSKWYWVSVINQIFQLVSVSIGSYLISYAGLGYINIVLGWGQEFSLGFDAKFSPGFAFYKYPETLQTQSLGIDVLAILFLFAFIRVNDYEERD